MNTKEMNMNLLERIDEGMTTHEDTKIISNTISAVILIVVVLISVNLGFAAGCVTGSLISYIIGLGG